MSAIAEMVGASFIALTLSAKLLFTVAVPSVTASEIFADPCSLALGVKVTLQTVCPPELLVCVFAIPEASTRAELSDVIVSEPAQVRADSTSEIVIGIERGVSSFVLCAPGSVTVGKSFDGVTLNENVLEEDDEPSVTMKVMKVESAAFKTGLIVAVHEGQVPAKVTAPTLATTAGFMDA